MRHARYIPTDPTVSKLDSVNLLYDSGTPRVSQTAKNVEDPLWIWSRSTKNLLLSMLSDRKMKEEIHTAAAFWIKLVPAFNLKSQLTLKL